MHIRKEHDMKVNLPRSSTETETGIDRNNVTRSADSQDSTSSESAAKSTLQRSKQCGNDPEIVTTECGIETKRNRERVNDERTRD
jgi:hypothetical protein